MSQLLSYCYHRIPYYREQFRKIGAKPEDFRTIVDLRHFPVLEKQTLRDRSAEFTDPEADRSEWIRYSSSGSTGIPLELRYHPSERHRMGFTMTRSFMFLGLRPWHCMANITEPRHFSPKERWYHRLGFMNEQFLSIFDKTEFNLNRLKEIRPHFLIGFPSILVLIGKQMLEETEPPLRPKFLYTIAEVLTSEYKRTLTKQWGLEPMDIYGANEAGTIAWQCLRRDHYHINLDSVYVELMDGDRPAGPGERGEVVVTNLDLRVMPIVRYRVGDIAEKVDGNCPCGCRFPLLGRITGRSDGFIVGMDGKHFSALEVSLLLHPIEGIRHYRLVQEKYGKVRVEWVPGTSSANPMNKILCILREHLGEKIEIDARQVNEIPREKSGKIRSVISKLPHPYWQYNG